MQTQARFNPTGKMQERRLYPRVIAPQRALVAVAGDNLGLPYNMTDISEGGLSFMYLGRNPLSFTDSLVDLYLNEKLQISRLPVMVVGDRELEGYYIPKRRCSLSFGQLTDIQRLALRSFISHHASTDCC